MVLEIEPERYYQGYCQLKQFEREEVGNTGIIVVRNGHLVGSTCGLRSLNCGHGGLSSHLYSLS